MGHQAFWLPKQNLSIASKMLKKELRAFCMSTYNHGFRYFALPMSTPERYSCNILLSKFLTPLLVQGVLGRDDNHLDVPVGRDVRARLEHDPEQRHESHHRFHHLSHLELLLPSDYYLQFQQDFQAEGLRSRSTPVRCHLILTKNLSNWFVRLGTFGQTCLSNKFVSQEFRVNF